MPATTHAACCVVFIRTLLCGLLVNFPAKQAANNKEVRRAKELFPLLQSFGWACVAVRRVNYRERLQEQEISIAVSIGKNFSAAWLPLIFFPNRIIFGRNR